MRRELADILSREVSDPRLGQLTVSGVEVSRDLAHAKVFVIPARGLDMVETMGVLRKATGYLRRTLANRLHVRSMPALRFEHDQSLENALHLSELIDSAVAADRQDDPEDE